MRNKFIIAATASTLLLASSLTALAAPVSTAPGQNKLQCFSGTTDGGTYGGTCALQGNGAMGPATLNNSDSNTNGDYSGVYITNSGLIGQPLSSVTQLSYTYSGTVAPMPGDLSLNIPINTSGGTTTEEYAYVDAYYCPGVGGHVDVVNDANCGIWFNGVEYANWAALVAAYPDAVITDTPFMVAERTPSEPSAVWTINKVKLGKPGK